MATTPSPGRFLTARWRFLAMLNYEIDPAIVQAAAPSGVEVDFFEDRTYVSVVGFMFEDTRLLGFPVPGHRVFEEVNLRYYVVRHVGDEARRGVAFVTEIVPRRAIAFVARRVYNENYVALPMRHRLTGVQHPADGPPTAEYEWKFRGRWHGLRMATRGEAAPLVEGSHEQFIAEHYWGYCGQRDGGAIEYRVEHPPWRIWQSEDVSLDCDVEALYGAQFVEALSRPPASAFLAEGSAVSVQRPVRI